MSRKNKTQKKDPGYPAYEPEADIYKKGIKEDSVEIEELSRTGNIPIAKKPKEKKDESPLIDDDAMSVPGIASDDLDVPGTELDDEKEDIGAEDEENNYYSLGGDDHEDLEEDKTGS